MRMRIPSTEECYRLICEMEMMDHIVAHSIRVCQVAILLTDNLAQCEDTLNRDLIQASALLHDITKTRSFKTGENHAVTAQELLKQLGYPEVAYIVGQHVRLNVYSVSTPPVEAEIVNYADKRVLHDSVVPLKERLDYVLEKYVNGPGDMGYIKGFWINTEMLEEKLFAYLPFKPEEISSLIKSEDFDAAMAAFQCVRDSQIKTN